MQQPRPRLGTELLHERRAVVGVVPRRAQAHQRIRAHREAIVPELEAGFLDDQRAHGKYARARAQYRKADVLEAPGAPLGGQAAFARREADARAAPVPHAADGLADVGEAARRETAI